MKLPFLILIPFLSVVTANGQTVDFSQHWMDSVIRSDPSFKKMDVATMAHLDIGDIIGNGAYSESGPSSSYIGFFGPKYRRIDLRFSAQKKEGPGTEYRIEGKSRMGSNIRPLKGTMKLTEVLEKKEVFGYITLYICLFDYEIAEPGDKEGDGTFKGVASAVFSLDKGVPQPFWSESGDYRDLANVFVGTWHRRGAKTVRKCIFSFAPTGLYNKLPYCEEVYVYEDDFDDLPYIDPEFIRYGWEDYDQDGVKKTDWWN